MGSYETCINNHQDVPASRADGKAIELMNGRGTVASTGWRAGEEDRQLFFCSFNRVPDTLVSDNPCTEGQATQKHFEKN